MAFLILAALNLEGVISKLENILLVMLLITASLEDLFFMRLPDKLTLIIFLTGLFYHGWQGIVYAVILGGIMLVIALIFLGSVGGGDIKYAAALGCWLSDEKIFMTLFIAFTFGGIISLIVLMVKGKSARKMLIPFGPFLSAGAVASIFWGNELWILYGSILGSN